MNIGSDLRNIPIKYILFDSIKHYLTNEEENETRLFLSDKVFLNIASKNPIDFYTDSYNWHHFTTKFLYAHAEEILNYIGLPFNKDDFELIEDIENGEDFSYLKSNKNYSYRVYYDTYQLLDHYVGICERIKNEEFKIEDIISCDVNNKDVLGSIGYPVTTPYHKLYRFSHQNSYVRNLNVRNGIKLLISCDSFMVPLIPLILPYCEEVTIMDNRFFNWRYQAFKTNEYTMIIYGISFSNELKKYLEFNL